MLKRLLIISTFFLLILPFNSYPGDQKTKIKGPITVTSETLLADNKAHTALFENNVVAKTTDMIIYADKMLVFYKEVSGDVTKIEATGNVKVYKDSRLITSQEAIYFSDEEKIIFTGNARATEGENVITGTKITYYIRDDRSNVEKSKVILKGKQER